MPKRELVKIAVVLSTGGQPAEAIPLNGARTSSTRTAFRACGSSAT